MVIVYNLVFDYFENKFWTEFLPIVNAFKAARFIKVTELKPTASSIDELKVFSFLEDVILNLKAELAEYLGLAVGVTKIDILEWWLKNEEKLPHWAAAYKKIILCQPSSAATERVFSIMKSSFNSEQNLALEDYMEVSLMLQYNKKRLFFLFKLPA